MMIKTRISMNTDVLRELIERKNILTIQFKTRRYKTKNVR